MDDVELGIRRKVGAGLSVQWDRGSDVGDVVRWLDDFVGRVQRAMLQAERFWPGAPLVLRVDELPDGGCRIVWEAEKKGDWNAR